MRVGIDYTYAEAYGLAEVGYLFEVGKTVLLAAGGACRIEHLKPGIQFQLKQGGFGSVTKVDPPIPWPAINPARDKNGNIARRILGTIKHVGYVVVDVVVGGQAITTTPDHRFRLNRGEWVPAAQLRKGDTLVGVDKRPVSVESVSAPRHGFIELYNLEVERDHNFFVQGKSTHGDPVPGINVHNGYDYINLPAEGSGTDVSPAVLDYVRNHPLPMMIDPLDFRKSAFSDLMDLWAPARETLTQLKDFKLDLQYILDEPKTRWDMKDALVHKIDLIDRVINTIQRAIDGKGIPEHLVLDGMSTEDAEFYRNWLRAAGLSGINVHSSPLPSSGEMTASMLPFAGEMSVSAVAGRTLLYSGGWNFSQYVGGNITGGNAIKYTATSVAVNVVATAFGQYVVAPALNWSIEYFFPSASADWASSIRVTQFYDPYRGAFGPGSSTALYASAPEGNLVYLEGASGGTWVAPYAAEDMNWFSRMLTGRGNYTYYVEFSVSPAELQSPGGFKYFYAPYQKFVPEVVDLTARNAVFGQLGPNYGQTIFFITTTSGTAAGVGYFIYEQVNK